MSNLLSDTRRSTLSADEVWRVPTRAGGRDTSSDQDISSPPTDFSGFGDASIPVFETGIVVDLIEPLLSLPDNWDGHGALSPAPTAIGVCSEFLRSAPEAMLRPDVMASVDGGVLLEWESDEVDLLLNIDAHGHVSIFLRQGHLEYEGSLASHKTAVAETLSSFVHLPH